MLKRAGTIEIEEIRTVLNSILNHISDDLNIKSITLDEDYYWSVSSDSLFSSDKKPADFELGSLRDDWEFLREILHDKDQSAALMLVHAAPILRYIGEKVGQ